MGTDSPDDPTPPDAVLVNRRWVPAHVVSWVQRADAIMVEHGAVSGNNRYEARHQARWRAQKLIRYMVELGVHERWELREHTDMRNDGAVKGWIWTVELVGGGRRG